MAFLLGQGLATGETPRTVNSLIFDGSYQARRKEPSTSEMGAQSGQQPALSRTQASRLMGPRRISYEGKPKFQPHRLLNITAIESGDDLKSSEPSAVINPSRARAKSRKLTSTGINPAQSYSKCKKCCQLSQTACRPSYKIISEAITLAYDLRRSSCITKNC